MIKFSKEFLGLKEEIMMLIRVTARTSTEKVDLVPNVCKDNEEVI